VHQDVQGSCIQPRFVSSANPHVIAHQLTLQHAISKEAFEILSNTTDAQGRKLQASPHAKADCVCSASAAAILSAKRRAWRTLAHS